MKRLCLLFIVLLSVVTTSFSQDIIKEIDGIYLKDTIPYSGDYTVYFDNRIPKIEMILVNGLKEGAVKVYFETGVLNEIRSYKQNMMDGTWLTFNEKKVRIAEARYSNGKKDGKWFIWNDNGTLIYELEYKAGEKTGIWKNYDNTGKLISERYYSTASETEN